MKLPATSALPFCSKAFVLLTNHFFRRLNSMSLMPKLFTYNPCVAGRYFLLWPRKPLFSKNDVCCKSLTNRNVKAQKRKKCKNGELFLGNTKAQKHENARTGNSFAKNAKRENTKMQTKTKTRKRPNTKHQNEKTRKREKPKKPERAKTRKRENPKMRKLKRNLLWTWKLSELVCHISTFTRRGSRFRKKKNQIWHLNWEGSISTWYVYKCMRLFVHIYTYTCCCLAMNMPCISCWISWIGRIPPTEVAAAATLLPGARDISKAKSLLFKVLGCLHSVSTRQRDAGQIMKKIWWNNVGWQVDMWALISKSWKSVLISFGVGFAWRCTPVLFLWPSDTDPLVQAFGGSC